MSVTAKDLTRMPSPFMMDEKISVILRIFYI